ncbi:hypothetical protein BpHYR1_005794 [Brachionus plicatilis]|uniref:Uncharacterized protein n=1 Tax=Brachionus plicatilis TaxID=10195 RepID=A0A3M7QE97_BRAPC|nr:hypothetical protein BpHYR1_005794 [Brachionus plicatilis]
MQQILKPEKGHLVETHRDNLIFIRKYSKAFCSTGRQTGKDPLLGETISNLALLLYCFIFSFPIIMRPPRKIRHFVVRSMRKLSVRNEINNSET